MKKLLILVVLILMLFTACGTEAPVMPEPEAEQSEHTEQEPVEEQPQVDVPEVPEEPEEAEEPQEPEVPEESEEPVEPEEPEEPEIIETVSYAQAIEEIAAITNQKPQEFAEYAEVWAFPAGKYQTGGEEPISYADAATLLYFAAEKDPEYLNMAHVTREYPELKDIHGETGRYAMYMYKWGVLYGDPPNDWYADIPAEKYNEMLLRAGSPELRLELLPDQLTLLSWKLDEVSYCSCIQTNTRPKVNPAKERLITVLSDWEGLDRALECSYWIQERKGNVYYLNMFTGMEDGTISFTRCKYDCGIEQGEILETRTLEPYDLYGSETDILRCVCMTDEQKERLDQELLEQYLTSFRESSEDSFCIPFFEGYTVAYAWPWRGEPAVMLISLHENKLRSESLTWLNDGVWWYGDMLSHSWYHIYSMDISTGLDALRNVADNRKEQQRQKAMEAAFCPCMAREFAEWRVYGNSELVPVVRTAFADYVAAHSGDLAKGYGDLLTDTYWLIDQDWNGRYYLQIIQFKKTSAAQLVMLVYDGNTVEIHEGFKELSGMVDSVCANRCTEENRKAVEEMFEISDNTTEMPELFMRWSALTDGSCVTAQFGVDLTLDDTRTVGASYHGPIVLSGSMELKDLLKPEKRVNELSHWLEKVYAMDYSELYLGEDLLFTLDFLTAELTVENGISYWNLPANTLYHEWLSEAYMLRGSLLLFLEELERDPALKELFMQMEQWKVHRLDLRCSFSGADSAGREWEAVVYPGIGVDVVGWETPTRKELREIAANGKNSEVVPESVRDQFLDCLLQDYWKGQSLVGKGGDAQWFWSITEEGNPRLEVHYYSGSIQVLDEERPYEIFILEKRDGTVNMIDHIDRHEPLPEI